MDLKRLRLAGIVFLFAGILSLVAAVRGERATFLLFGCSFVVIGGAFLVRSRTGSPAQVGVSRGQVRPPPAGVGR